MSSLTGKNYTGLPGEIMLVMHPGLFFFPGVFLKHAKDSAFSLMLYIVMTGRLVLFRYISRLSISLIHFSGKQLLCSQSITSAIRDFSRQQKCPLPVSEERFLILKA